jgi:hypothetical protein
VPRVALRPAENVWGNISKMARYVAFFERRKSCNMLVFIELRVTQGYLRMRLSAFRRRGFRTIQLYQKDSVLLQTGGMAHSAGAL